MWDGDWHDGLGNGESPANALVFSFEEKRLYSEWFRRKDITNYPFIHPSAAVSYHLSLILAV